MFSRFTPRRFSHTSSHRLRPRLEALEARAAPSDAGIGAFLLSGWVPALDDLDLNSLTVPSVLDNRILLDRSTHAVTPAFNPGAAASPDTPLSWVVQGPLPIVPADPSALRDRLASSLRQTGPTGPDGSGLYTVLWGPTSEYIDSFAQAFVAEGRIGNIQSPPATFQLDIGPNTGTPTETANYVWDQDRGHPFTFSYDAQSGVATFDNNGVVLHYSPTWSGDPAADTLFLRAHAMNNQSALTVADLYLYTPALGDFVPVPDPDGGSGPAAVGVKGPDQESSLQLRGAVLQDGFTLTGTSYWTYATKGPDVPRNSQLAFQIMVGTWNAA